jgi:hypothetical protein
MLKRASVRGYPLDMHELRLLEVRARMLDGNYRTSVTTISSKIREEKRNAHLRLQRVGRTMLRTLRCEGGVDVKAVSTRVAMLRGERVGSVHDDSFSVGGAGTLSRMSVPMRTASSGTKTPPATRASPMSRRETTRLPSAASARDKTAGGGGASKSKSAAALSPEQRVAQLVAQMQGEAAAIGPATDKVIGACLLPHACLAVCFYFCVCVGAERFVCWRGRFGREAVGVGRGHARRRRNTAERVRNRWMDGK